jgi:hypothetical protein
VPAGHDYCTVFDRRYAARALAMYRSLERWDPGFVLRAVCMDSASSDVARRLALPNLRITPIEEIEHADGALGAVRAGRTIGEYCWTAKPAVCRYFMETEPDLELLTYFDADLFFWSSPAPLFAELGNDSILLIPHRTLSETEQTVGVYTGGWVTFRNDARGQAAVRWWRERCLEWCYDRVEPGRFADQKYLDDWPTRFEGVRVSALAAAGLGPWNETRHQVSPAPDGGPLLVDGAPLIFFYHSGIHAHRVTRISRLLDRRTGEPELVEDRGVSVEYTFSHARSVPAVRDLVWRPYMASLTTAIGELAAAQPPVAEWLDAPRYQLLVRHFLRRRIPGLAATYRRLPFGLRH